MAGTNLETTVFEYSPIIPIRFTHKPNKYVLKAEEFNNYMHGLTTACGSYYTCIKELQQKFDSLTVTGVKDNSIMTAHLKNGAVTAEKIADNSIQNTHIFQDAVTWDKIAPGTFYQLLRKTFGIVDRNSALAVQEIIIEHPANEDQTTGTYIIPDSKMAQGIILNSGGSWLNRMGTDCHVLFNDEFRISLTNPLDQGWSDSTTNTRHVLSRASNSTSTLGLEVMLYRNNDGNLVLDYVIDFWHPDGPASAGTYKLYYALF